MNDRLNERLAALPSLDRLLQAPRVAAAVAAHGRTLVVAELRSLLARHRARLRRQANGGLSFDALVSEFEKAIESQAATSLRRVFNLTGTVLHTNLGRARVPREAAAAAANALAQECNLEYDLAAGERGERDAHLEALVCRLTGAQAATVVNNNAAAVFLALNTLAAGREVPVSRGELVEIGGAFRVPDIMKSAGCTLVEVGTTNRTHLRDFQRACNERTAAIMRVHTSNYAIVGFVATPTDEALAGLAHKRRLPFVTDLGSGSLVDLTRWGLPREPTVQGALRAGADLVTFSGDKLLGGPQAGLIAGRRDLVARLNANPLKRALRVDKGRIAALETVLRLYLDPDRLAERLPALRLLTRQAAEIEQVAKRLQGAVQAHAGSEFVVEVAPCASQIGSGSLPVDRLPSCAIRIRCAGRASGRRLEALAAALRALPIPVIGRVHDDALWLDLRCLDDEAAFVAQLGALGR